MSIDKSDTTPFPADTKVILKHDASDSSNKNRQIRKRRRPRAKVQYIPSAMKHDDFLRFYSRKNDVFVLLDNIPMLAVLIGHNRTPVYQNKIFQSYFSGPDDIVCFINALSEIADNVSGFLSPISLVRSDFQVTAPNGHIIRGYVVPLADYKGHHHMLVLGFDMTLQRNLELEYQESAERFRVAFQNSPDMMSISTLEEGRYIDVNDRLQETLELTREQIIGHSAKELDVWVNKADRDKIIARLLEKHRVIGEPVQFQLGENRVIDTEMSAEILEIGGEAAFISIVRDVTQNRLIETALRDSERLKSDVISFLPDALFAISMSGEVIAWNREMEKLTGIPSDTVVGFDCLEHILSNMGIQIPLLLNRFIQGNGMPGDIFYRQEGIVISENYYYPDLNGREVHLWAIAAPLFNSRGELIGAIESLRDITFQRRAEETLRASEERFSKSFYFSPYPMAIISTEDDSYVEVNDSFCYLSEYARDELIGNTSTGLILLYNLDDIWLLKKVLQEESSIMNHEMRCKNKSGKALDLLFSAVTINIAGINCRLCIFSDITERKQIERELSRLDRLNLVGEIAASIGHEIRNPMTTVRGFLQLLKSRYQQDTSQTYFDLMIDELDRANNIISEFLLLARTRYVDLKPMDLNLIINNLFPLIQVKAASQEKYVDLALAPLPTLMLDEKEIRQLLLNFVLNGLEAMQSGGQLEISTETNNGSVVLSVIDHGCGIPNETLDKIGQPFFSTKENGTGLGLAVCYNIAARHGATILFDTGSQGTTFSVQFPTVQPESAAESSGQEQVKG